MLELGDYETLQAAQKICEREGRERRTRIGPGPHVMLLEVGEAVLARIMEWADAGRTEKHPG